MAVRNKVVEGRAAAESISSPHEAFMVAVCSSNANIAEYIARLPLHSISHSRKTFFPKASK